MIHLTAILSLYATKLAESAELEAWCQLHFGKSATIFVGVDTREPPGSANVPFVVLQPGAEAAGDEVAEFSYLVTVDWCVLAETVTTAGAIKTMDGLTRVDEMGRLILEALRDASDNVTLSSWNYTIEQVEFFPMVMAGLDITLNVPHILGGAVTL